jgi:hypothetical protein
MAANGRLSASELAPIPGGRLRKDAARSWNDMREFIGRRHGVWIRPRGTESSYRTFAAQQYFRRHWCGRGQCYKAAVPGTSNHGEGRAVDVATRLMAYYIRLYGSRFGWSWAEGRRVGEWWHMVYIGGYKPQPSRPRLPGVLAADEAGWANKLRYHRQQYRREARTGRGARYREHYGWARYFRRKIESRMALLLRLGRREGFVKLSRGARRKALGDVLAGKYDYS